MRVTVAAWIGSKNLGDELVFRALTRQLVDRGAHVEALSTDPASTRSAHDVGARRRQSSLIRGTELTVLGGGGLLQDETSTLNLDLHLAPVWAARARREPVLGVGLGAGRLTTRGGRLRVRLALAGVPVAVRDPASADLLADLGLERPVVAADLVFSLPAPVAEPADRIVACLRPWGGRRHRLPARLRRHRPDDGFASGAARSLDELSRGLGLPVHLVAFDAPKDSPLHESVAQRMQATVTTSAPGLDHVLDEVAASRLVVAMRYHGGVAATLAGRPSVLVGYSSKVDSLAQDLGTGACGIRWTPGGPGDLAAAAEGVVDREDHVIEARDALVEREKGNGRVIDDVLDRIRRAEAG